MRRKHQQSWYVTVLDSRLQIYPSAPCQCYPLCRCTESKPNQEYWAQFRDSKVAVYAANSLILRSPVPSNQCFSLFLCHFRHSSPSSGQIRGGKDQPASPPIHVSHLISRIGSAPQNCVDAREITLLLLTSSGFYRNQSLPGSSPAAKAKASAGNRSRTFST